MFFFFAPSREYRARADARPITRVYIDSLNLFVLHGWGKANRLDTRFHLLKYVQNQSVQTNKQMRFASSLKVGGVLKKKMFTTRPTRKHPNAARN